MAGRGSKGDNPGISKKKNVAMAEGQVSSEKRMLQGWRAGFHPKRDVSRAEGIVSSEKGMLRGRRA